MSTDLSLLFRLARLFRVPLSLWCAVTLGECGSATVDGKTFSAVVTGCKSAAGAAALASLPLALLLAFVALAANNLA